MLVQALKRKHSLSEIVCDALVLGIFEESREPFKEVQTDDKTIDNLISQIIRDLPDCAKFGKTNVIHTSGITKAKRIILTGLGKKETITIDKIRKVSAISLREAQKLHSPHVVFSYNCTADIGLDNKKSIQAIVEGAILGTYRFDYYKTDKKIGIGDEGKITNIEKLIILENDEIEKNFKTAISEGNIIAKNVNFARDLTNHPPKYMTPSKMAEEAAELASKYGLNITVLDKEEMKKQNMNAILAVARGSSEPPKLIALKYEGNPKSKKVLGLVGKGITFDSGGISLKPSEGMEKMTRDMAGAAVVLGAVAAISKLKLKVNVLGVMPCAENMPSGSALCPGDIITSMNGKTIEVVNTDAEGRLILADAITYAKKEGVTYIVDVATLTGACVIALGTVNSGVISNNRDLCAQLMNAAKEAGENMWELPNNEEYLKQIKSDVADLKNVGGRPAGAITAGVFIGQFVGETPWVHIDIAGTSDTDKADGYNQKGATGVGVRTLVELAKSLQKA